MPKKSFTFRSITWSLIAVLFVNFALPSGMAYAQIMPSPMMPLPAPGTMVTTTSGFTPLLLQGVVIDPQNPLRLKFVVDTGNSELQGEALNKEALKVIKYFFAALTTPQDDMWVNLSPYEKDKIVPEFFGQTEMGRDMLAQDYILKQLTASLMFPDEKVGKEFWSRVYARAQALYGRTDIPFNTFNKIWIIPQSATVHETVQGAVMSNPRMKVMLERDYLATAENADNPRFGSQSVSAEQSGQTDELTQEMVREVLLPEIEREVNEGENFANLRQIYSALVLAYWYKQSLKQSLLGQIYADKNKIVGVNTEDKAEKEKIYQQYLDAFKKGAYDFIKEELDPATQEIIPRKYYSGGMGYELSNMKQAVTIIPAGPGSSSPIVRVTGQELLFDTAALGVGPDANLLEADKMVSASLGTEMTPASSPVNDKIWSIEQIFSREIPSNQPRIRVGFNDVTELDRLYTFLQGHPEIARELGALPGQLYKKLAYRVFSYIRISRDSEPLVLEFWGNLNSNMEFKDQEKRFNQLSDEFRNKLANVSGNLINDIKWNVKLENRFYPPTMPFNISVSINDGRYKKSPASSSPISQEEFDQTLRKLTTGTDQEQRHAAQSLAVWKDARSTEALIQALKATKNINVLEYIGDALIAIDDPRITAELNEIVLENAAYTNVVWVALRVLEENKGDSETATILRRLLIEKKAGSNARRFDVVATTIENRVNESVASSPAVDKEVDRIIQKLLDSDSSVVIEELTRLMKAPFSDEALYSSRLYRFVKTLAEGTKNETIRKLANDFISVAEMLSASSDELVSFPAQVQVTAVGEVFSQFSIAYPNITITGSDVALKETFVSLSEELILDIEDLFIKLNTLFPKNEITVRITSSNPKESEQYYRSYPEDSFKLDFEISGAENSSQREEFLKFLNVMQNELQRKGLAPSLESSDEDSPLFFYAASPSASSPVGKVEKIDIRPGEAKPFRYSETGPILIQIGYNNPEADVFFVSARDLRNSKATDPYYAASKNIVEDAPFYLVSQSGQILALQIGTERLLGRTTSETLHKKDAHPFDWRSPGIAINQMGILVVNEDSVRVRDTLQDEQGNGIKVSFTQLLSREKSFELLATMKESRVLTEMKGQQFVFQPVSRTEIMDGLESGKFLGARVFGEGVIITESFHQQYLPTAKIASSPLSDVDNNSARIAEIREQISHDWHAMTTDGQLKLIQELNALRKTSSKEVDAVLISILRRNEANDEVRKAIEEIFSTPLSSSSPVDAWRAADDTRINVALEYLFDSPSAAAVTGEISIPEFRAYAQGKVPENIKEEGQQILDAFWLTVKYQLNISHFADLLQRLKNQTLTMDHIGKLTDRNGKILSAEDRQGIYSDVSLLFHRWGIITYPRRQIEILEEKKLTADSHDVEAINEEIAALRKRLEETESLLNDLKRLVESPVSSSPLTVELLSAEESRAVINAMDTPEVLTHITNQEDFNFTPVSREDIQANLGVTYFGVSINGNNFIVEKEFYRQYVQPAVASSPADSEEAAKKANELLGLLPGSDVPVSKQAEELIRLLTQPKTDQTQSSSPLTPAERVEAVVKEIVDGQPKLSLIVGPTLIDAFVTDVKRLSVEERVEYAQLLNQSKSNIPVRFIEKIDEIIEQIKPKDSPSVAQSATTKPDKTGGIDFNPDFLNLDIKRDGNGIPLPVNLQPLPILEQQLQGIVPIIINVTPVMNLSALLGITPDADFENETIAYIKEDQWAKEPDGDLVIVK